MTSWLVAVEQAIAAGIPKITIGRDPAANSVIIDSPLVSRGHAELVRIAPPASAAGAANGGGAHLHEYALTDLGSANGTFVGSKRLRKGESRSLVSNDLVTFGPRQLEAAFEFRYRPSAAVGAQLPSEHAAPPDMLPAEMLPADASRLLPAAPIPGHGVDASAAEGARAHGPLSAPRSPAAAAQPSTLSGEHEDGLVAARQAQEEHRRARKRRWLEPADDDVGADAHAGLGPPALAAPSPPPNAPAMPSASATLPARAAQAADAAALAPAQPALVPRAALDRRGARGLARQVAVAELAQQSALPDRSVTLPVTLPVMLSGTGHGSAASSVPPYVAQRARSPLAPPPQPPPPQPQQQAAASDRLSSSEQLSSYEKARLDNIAANALKLSELGLDSGALLPAAAPHRPTRAERDAARDGAPRLDRQRAPSKRLKSASARAAARAAQVLLARTARGGLAGWRESADDEREEEEADGGSEGSGACSLPPEGDGTRAAGSSSDDDDNAMVSSSDDEEEEEEEEESSEGAHSSSCEEMPSQSQPKRATEPPSAGRGAGAKRGAGRRGGARGRGGRGRARSSAPQEQGQGPRSAQIELNVWHKRT